jgi:hypothetical protein
MNRDMQIVLGNISSFKLHHADVFSMIHEHDAHIALLTETRIRDDIKSSRILAAQAGFGVLLSDPRPLKSAPGGGQGPREGGVAVLLKAGWNVPDLGRTMGGFRLDPEYACHTAVPLHDGRGSPLLHVIVAYCSRDDEQQRRTIFEYAETLGDVPVVIGADWNKPPEQSAAVTQAILSGKWSEAVQMLAERGDEGARL